MLDKDAPMPPSIGLCADEYAEVRALRLAMQKEVDEVEARERKLRDHIIENLSKSLDSGAAGLRYRAQIVTKQKPTVTDWGKLSEYVLANGRLDLLQHRISDKAVTDMWGAGEDVPGVEKFNAVEVSITKIPRR